MTCVLLFNVGDTDIALDMLPTLRAVVDRHAFCGIIVNFAKDRCTAAGAQDVISALAAVTTPLIQLNTPNRGRDMGGYMRMCQALLDTDWQPAHLLFVHTKTEPTWRNSMLEIVCNRSQECIHHLDTNPATLAVGERVDKFDQRNLIFIIGACRLLGWIPPVDISSATLQRFKFSNHTEALTKRYARQHGTRDFDFISGSMYWIKGPAWLDMYRTHRNTFQVIEGAMQMGNIFEDWKRVCTAHAMERMFGYAAIILGMVVQALPQTSISQ